MLQQAGTGAASTSPLSAAPQPLGRHATDQPRRRPAQAQIWAERRRQAAPLRHPAANDGAAVQPPARAAPGNPAATRSVAA